MTDTTTDPAPAADEQPEPDTEAVRPELVTDDYQPEHDPDDAPIRGEVVHIRPDGGTTGLVPLGDELRGVAELAVTLATSNLVPRALREKPADVLAVLLTGRELGVAPMTALRTFHVIEGTVTLAPKVRLAMVHQQGVARVYPHQAPRHVGMDDEGQALYEYCPCGSDAPANDDQAATWHAERTDTPGVIYGTVPGFTIEQARAVTFDVWSGPSNARVKTKQSLAEKDNYQNYPARMLSWRALGYLLDDACPEVGTGLYQPDELGAVTDEDGLPRMAMDTDPLVPRTSADVRAQGATGRAVPGSQPPCSPDTMAELEARIARIGAHADGAREVLVAMWKEQDDQGNYRLRPLKHLLHSEVPIAKAVLDAIEKRCKAGEWGPWEPATPLDGPTAGADGEDAPEQPADADGAHSGQGAAEPDGVDGRDMVGPPADQRAAAAMGTTDAEYANGNDPEPDPVPDTEPDPDATPDVPPPAQSAWQAAGLPYDPEFPPDPVTNALVAYLAASSELALQAALETRGLKTTGNAANLRQRLGVALLAEGWLPHSTQDALPDPDAEPEQQQLG